MLDPKELRIGNHLYYNGKIDEITAIDLDLDDEGVPLVSFSDSNPVELNYGKVEPIQLTHKVAESLGFKMDDILMWAEIALNESPNILKINVGGGVGHGTVWLINTLSSINLPSCLSVHQVQNLVLILSGKEIAFKK